MSGDESDSERSASSRDSADVAATQGPAETEGASGARRGTAAAAEAARVVEREPESAAEVFDDRIDLARAFTASLAERGEMLGLIGPRELSQLWTRHILNSAVVAPLLYGLVADVGSGAGLPGIVLGIARPDVQLTLIEPMERRCEWLRAEVQRLGLDNVEVVRARAEELHGTRAFHQVTARAVSAVRTLVPWTAPLVADGGELLLMKGARVHEELAAADTVLRKHRVTNVRVLELEAGDGAMTRVLRGTVRG